MKHGEVRIIGGEWRSRKLRFPALPGLRPTTDRIRETVFNWLSPYINGAHCLDLFAGSGALGLEALSRGAAFVTFIDSNPLVIKYLEEQKTIFKADNAQICQAKVPFKNLDQLTKKVDIVFLDPPFYKNLIEPCCQWLEQQSCLAENALIYIEAEHKLTPLPIPKNWEIIHSKISGQTGYHIVRVMRSSP